MIVNTPEHTVRATAEKFKGTHIHVLLWPSYALLCVCWFKISVSRNALMFVAGAWQTLSSAGLQSVVKNQAAILWEGLSTSYPEVDLYVAVKRMVVDVQRQSELSFFLDVRSLQQGQAVCVQLPPDWGDAEAAESQKD